MRPESLRIDTEDCAPDGGTGLDRGSGKQNRLDDRRSLADRGAIADRGRTVNLTISAEMNTFSDQDRGVEPGAGEIGLADHRDAISR